MSNSRKKSPKSESVDGEPQEIEFKRESLSDENLTQALSSARVTAIKDEEANATTVAHPDDMSRPKLSRSTSPILEPSKTDLEDAKVKFEETNGHSSPKKTEIPKSKATRTTTSKAPPRVAPLFDHLRDVTNEAKATFTVIDSSTYQNKYLAFTESALECDCAEDWDPILKRNDACGEDSDCINRVTKMECQDDCTCGSNCQNQRFSRRLYADVSVIQTEKKGYGLRTNIALKAHDFIFEYIGEVIAEAAFRRRMIAYDQEGIKHFYFMSLSKGEFIDATRKGNLGRFCNHSCNPNCYVDKWVIGDKLRMGIFAEREIKAGEELVFNYNVDRYGANPQPCYCGESNCTGFIGGKTQTERGTKLSAATMEALGIEDSDSWDTTVAKRPRKKKTTEDDEEYVDSLQSKPLDPEGVTKVMAALMQCKEKWIAVRLLQRLQSASEEQVRQRIVKLHGYRILNSQLAAWREDENIVLQILELLDTLPRLTRNKIVDAKIDQALQPLCDHTDGRISSKAQSLLHAWSKLELAYRIPRKKRDETSTPTRTEPTHFERRESANERKRSRSRSKSPPKGPAALSAPSGPRALQRSGNFPPRPSSFHRNPSALPRGWFAAQDNGKIYYYSASGKTTWTRPTQPAEQLPPQKQSSEQDVLKSIIDNIVSAKEKETKTSTPETPEASKKEKEPKVEKWRSYDEEKKKKLYENTLFPHISHVMNKYKHKIPREDLKRFAKEITKKLVASDFKAGRVQDPTRIDERQQRKVKDFCKQFFDKAAQKHKQLEEEKVARKGTAIVSNGKTLGTSTTTAPTGVSEAALEIKKEEVDDDEIKMSDDEEEEHKEKVDQSPAESTSTLKRKREVESDTEVKSENDAPRSPIKRLAEHPPPPPPPPAPPNETPPGTTPRDELDASLHVHGDTNFKNKSMADVLAQAQQEDEEEMEIDHSPEIKAEIGENGYM